jgi:threonyl-tRNA synthetase
MEESKRRVWVSGGISVALNLIDAGYRPVKVGLGERDFFVDFESDRGISLEEAKAFAKNRRVEVQVKERRVKYNGVEFEVELEPAGEARFIYLTNVSTHHPDQDRQYVRIRGVAFETEEELKRYLDWLREAEEVDHRILGERLDLFSFHEEAGPGIVLYHPKGAVIRNELMNYMRQINSSMGYQEVYTSHVYRAVLWRISGHYSLYKDKMLLFRQEDEEVGVKPMNCPAHIMIYKSRTRSYRELPVRFSEFGHVYRWEKKGELYGLLRTRGFTQDDGHIFLAEDQLEQELRSLVEKTVEVLSKLGFRGDDVRVNLSTKPDESIGSQELWDRATGVLRKVLEQVGLKYLVKEKEGAFYGPKIDFDIRDSLGRWWQLSTVQVDFALPERFKLEYVDRGGERRRPVMIHRAIYGSIDRFMAILLEHYRGKLPTWLCPIQVRILPVTFENSAYGLNLMRELTSLGVRAEVDAGEETLSRRVKRAYDDGVPYILVVGKREVEEGTVTVRGRGNVELKGVNVQEFESALLKEIGERSSEQIVLLTLKGK